MIPLGYLYKRVVDRPEWIKAPQVTDIYSLTSCVAENFADYIKYWKHNGYWLFNSPEEIVELASAASISLEGQKLFYYEAFELQYDDDEQTWSSFEPEPSFTTEVALPVAKKLEGFDVATFSLGTSPECSPLSCNRLAESLHTNGHCLIESLEEAKAMLEQGMFQHAEPGPFRIIAVYSIPDRYSSGSAK